MLVEDPIILSAFGGLVTAIVWMYRKLEDSIQNCQKEGEKKDNRIAELEKTLHSLTFEVGYLKGVHGIKTSDITTDLLTP